MKKTLLITLAICFGQLVFTQTATLRTSKGLRSAQKYIVREIFEDDKGGFYSIMLPNKQEYKSSDYVYVDYIDSSMARASHQILNLKEGQIRLRYEYLLEKDDKLWLFSSFLNKKLKKNTLFIQEVEKNSFRRVGELQELTTISFQSHKDAGRFHFTYSAVGKDFLVFAEAPKGSTQGLKVEMLVMSNELKVLEKQSLRWNVQIGNLKFKNVFYDGENLAFFAYQVVSQEYVVYHRHNKIDDFKRAVITAKGKSISDVEAYWDRDKIAFNGLYKQTMDAAVSGVFSVDFFGGEFDNYQEEPFFTESKRAFSPSVNHDVWSGLTVKKIINRGKGLVVLVCEQSSDFAVTYQSYNSSPSYGGGYYGGYGGGYYGGYGYGGGYYSSETVNYESFNNVVLIAIKDGKEVWRKLIPKKQSLEYSLAYYGSIAINSNEKGLFLYFNTSTEQASSEDGIATFSGGKKYALTEVFIDNKGEMTRVEVYRAGSNTREMPVISSFYFGTHQMMFLGRKGTQTKFYKLIVKD